MEEIRAKAPNLTEVQARRIARTESGKAQTALIQSRAQSLGHAFYRWSCSMDQRVRDSHREMHNVICRWDDPPDPEALAGERSYGHYHPRGIFNCRCTAEPITSMLDITFPARVHVAGKIITVGGAKRFIDLFGDNAA